MEPAAALWSDAELNRYLDDALIETGQVARVEGTADIDVTDGSGAVPDDLLYPISFLWTAPRRYLLPWPHGVFSNPTAQGSPLYYRLAGGTVEVWPRATGTLKLAYWRRASAFEGDGSTVALPEPEAVERIFIEYAVAKAKQKQGDPAYAMHAAEFSRLLGEYTARRLQATQVPRDPIPSEIYLGVVFDG